MRAFVCVNFHNAYSKYISGSSDFPPISPQYHNIFEYFVKSCQTRQALKLLLIGGIFCTTFDLDRVNCLFIIRHLFFIKMQMDIHFVYVGTFAFSLNVQECFVQIWVYLKIK